MSSALCGKTVDPVFAQCDSKISSLFFQVFKGEFQLPDFLKEQTQVW